MTLLIHHLHASQSERVIWLCEELGIPYSVKLYKRAPILAPADYKALHPQGTAPVIQHGDLMLAESGACVEYIYNTFTTPEQRGKLVVSPDEPEYAQFLYWWHWVNGSFQPTLGRLIPSKSAVVDKSPLMAMVKDRMDRALKGLDERLGQNQWLAGDRFTLADIMVVFPLTTMRHFFPYSLKGYSNIVEYLQRIGKREAYQRAMEKGDPGMELVLGENAPSKSKM